MLFPHHMDGGMDSNKVFRTDTEAHRYFGCYSPPNVGDFSDSHSLYFINSVNSHRGSILLTLLHHRVICKKLRAAPLLPSHLT